MADYSSEAEELLSAAVRGWVRSEGSLAVSAVHSRETTAGMRATTLCWLAQVKLDPSRVDAWNCLGNCFWKKKDLKAAMNCFTGAAKQVRLPRRRDGDSLPRACCPPTHRPISTLPLQSPNATSLRQLSMLMRQMGDTPQERAANIKVGRA